MKYMSFFNEIITFKTTNPFENMDNVKKVHATIESLLEKERPNPEDFRGIIPDREIDNDIKTVRELEEKWNREDTPEMQHVKMKASIAEYIIYKNLGTWINFAANPMMTAKADDFLRGVDLILESESEGTEEGAEVVNINHLGIGIDVALASETGVSNSVRNKEKKVLDILEKGEMSEARYVDGAYRGRIKDLPYIILAVSPSHVERLFSSVLEKGSTEREEKHILKHIVAYQILLQLGTYYTVAKSRGMEEFAYSLGVANNFAADLFGDAMNELEQNPLLWKKVENDAGTIEIKNFCTSLEESLTKESF